MREFTVNFTSQKKAVKVPHGTDVLTAAVKAGIMLHASCGGEGLCGECKVLIGGKEALACQSIVSRDIDVSIPKGSLETHAKLKAASEEFTRGAVLEREKAFAFSPMVRK